MLLMVFDSVIRMALYPVSSQAANDVFTFPELPTVYVKHASPTKLLPCTRHKHDVATTRHS